MAFSPVPLLGRSLRWRMTLLFSAVFAILLTILLIAARREVRQTLVAAGADRAGAAARELSGTLGRSIVSVGEQVRRLAADPVLVAVAEAPTPEGLDAARALLAPGAAPGARRAEIWDTQGHLILAAANPRTAATATGIDAYPANVAAPREAGVSEMLPAD